MTEPELSALHPITNLLGTIGPLLFGSFGAMYLIFLFLFDSSMIELLYISLAGLAMFIIGALTIFLQKDRLEDQAD